MATEEPMITFKREYTPSVEEKHRIRDGLLAVIDSKQEAGSQKEQRIQSYFEANTELFSVHNTYKNFFHQNMVLSKCPIGSLKTDYAYLSKKSDGWRVVFGEFELPEDKFFKVGSLDYTAKFNHALQQMQQWQIYVKENKGEILRFFELLYQPINMRDNPTEFAFELIYGRSEDKNKTRERKLNIAATAKSMNIDIMSYDTAINNMMERQSLNRKNVISYNGSVIRYKRLNVFPEWDFSVYNSEQINLTSEQRSFLIQSGVDIESWEQGSTLSQGGRKTRPLADLLGRFSA
ncbi:Shedu anti-phage system protein SduA domain-containing protein [Chromohalobacter nigrandesensis]|uniref:Shedu anti-phage system protein SduA domain-containing protein n=1 Tax=Chromohalobacter nigrandesensis TaxID=119863 RepID=UPI001FF2B298|nr:DUF4263 domain-containing protein [Chromohalobacter nigrandesensis]